MASHLRRSTLHVDDDGVRVIADGGVRRVVRMAGVAAVLVVATAAVVLLAIRRTPAARPAEVARGVAPAPASDRPASPAPAPAAASAPSAAPAPSPGRALAIARRRDAAAPSPTAPAAPGMSAKDAILALRAAGEQGGIAAFGVPGSKPVQSGIIVPDDFELPPGYLRHYQTTDDGEQLPPILKLHPDYELVDAQGNPVPLPESRIVPPDFAPPGLPLRMLDVPGGAGTRP